MTDTDIIIAAAELEGWKIYYNERTTKQWLCRDPQGRIIATGEEAITSTTLSKASFIGSVPPYLTSTDAAMRLVEKLKTDKDMDFHLDNEGAKWKCEIYDDCLCWIQRDPSLPRAITLACLKAGEKLP